MNKRMILVLALASLALGGCKKSDSKKAEETPAEETARTADPAPADPAPADPAPADPAPADPAPAPAPVATDKADPALMKAAEAYVRKNAAKGVEFDLKVEAAEGDFARLAATPKKPDDGAMVFMKRKGKIWTGVDMGTSIPCDDLQKQGFPENVSKGCD